jgi:hypothetical protein
MPTTETESFPVPIDVPNKPRKARRRRNLKKSNQPTRRSERLLKKKAKRLEESHVHEHTELDTTPGIQLFMEELWLLEKKQLLQSTEVSSG